MVGAADQETSSQTLAKLKNLEISKKEIQSNPPITKPANGAEEAVENGLKKKKKRRRKKKKKGTEAAVDDESQPAENGKSGPANQTDPPSVPLSKFFPSGKYPPGEMQEYVNANSYRTSSEEMRERERLESYVLIPS